MNFSVSDARGKWACARKACGKAAIVALALLALMPPADARSPFADLESALFGRPRVRPRTRAAVVPLPQPRPAQAPQAQAPQAQAPPARVPEEPPKPQDSVVLPTPRPAEAPQAQATQAEAPHPPEPEKPAPRIAAPAAPPQPSACRAALDESVAIAPSIPDIVGPGECGGTDLVRLEAIVLRDATRVPLKPAATLRCEMATAIAAWMRDDIAPLASQMGTAPAALDNFDSFDCRGRNRVAGAKVSEHGHANALDVRGIALKNGVSLALTDRATPRESREKVMQSVCARFSTVLGPGSDGYHEDHIHLDLAARRSGYRICQWAVDDAMPQVAPLMPAPRPDEAPPRAVADGKTENASPAAEPNREDDAEPEPAPPPRPVKKRRAR